MGAYLKVRTYSNKYGMNKHFLEKTEKRLNFLTQRTSEFSYHLWQVVGRLNCPLSLPVKSHVLVAQFTRSLSFGHFLKSSSFDPCE